MKRSPEEEIKRQLRIFDRWIKILYILAALVIIIAVWIWAKGGI